MTRMAIRTGIVLALAGLALAGCEQKSADGAAVAQGRAPEGTISDELPDLELLPNDAPLADPADLPPVPGAGPLVPPTEAPAEAAAPSPAPAPAEPALEGSIAE